MKKIPAYLVTGFLGAGKTSLINQLLADHPASEQWAVIVNEFGQVGVDGALLQKSQGIHVRQVAGGCICCTTAPLMRTALIRLLREQRPDRLIIEPSGLGHPAGILALLQEPGFASHLDIQPVICVVPCVALTDSRYQQSPEFKAQIATSSILILTQGAGLPPDTRIQYQHMLEQQYPGKTILLAPALDDLPAIAKHLAQLAPHTAFGEDSLDDLPPTRASNTQPIATGRWYTHQEHTRLSFGIRWPQQPPRYNATLEERLVALLAASDVMLLRGKALLQDQQHQWHAWQWTSGHSHWQNIPPATHQFFEIIVENSGSADVQQHLQQQIAGLWKQGTA
ncbi:CobW family GTP-binding protein [Leeia oryzae]|uniref:CobW family GTP-binding protein n=1 Tax=Leeia oryzae TaxID=356662 RepID=UPI000371EB7D|nr:GTP-binding protein [Leeia oryzae]